MLQFLRAGFSPITEQRVVLKIDDTVSIEFAIWLVSTGVIVPPPPPRPKLLAAEILDLGDPNRALAAVVEIAAIDTPRIPPAVGP
ncbi:MAG: hypothetical protein J7507_07805 [Pseudoxanthomonas sp.]|nr:hypothetical protein [Pseudoxanthomonas sp.]